MLNAGTLRAARAILPEGTIVNCTRPAAVGMRSMTCLMTQIVTLGAFVQALPDLMPATSPGGNAILNVKTTGRNGNTVMASIGPVGGGGGGTPFNDGSDGAGGLHGFLRNTPLEISEADVPILFRRYGLACDTGGAGQYRGGLSTIMEFEVTTPGTVVTARNRNRSIMSSWGVNGGREGCLSQFYRNPDRPGAEFLGNTDVVHCDPGDVIRVVGPGAGGFGDPRNRPVEAVQQDLLRGAISLAAAEADYGVVFSNGVLDTAATNRLRRGAGEASRPVIVHGPARQAFETLWTVERYALLTAFLSEAPVEWRYFLKHKVFAAITDRSDRLDMPEMMADIFEDLRSNYQYSWRRS